MPKATDFDHPIVFGFTMFLVVVGFICLFSWVFAALGWTGPLSVIKGGYITGSTQMGPAPQ